MLSIKRKLSISIKEIFLGEMGQESAIKKGNKNVSKNVLFQKEVQLYFDHSTRRSGGGGRKKRITP